jgi:N,N'-diacetylchitobiose transport system substrate-binding protein
VNRAACWALAIGSGLLLCSCTGSGAGSDADDDPTEHAELVGSLTTWFLDPGSAPARAAIEAATEAFEAEHAAVAVGVEYVPWAEGKQRLTAAVAAGEAPDVAQTSTEWTAELAAQDVLAPGSPADGVEYVDSLLLPAAVDGTNVGYPWYGATQALIYRTDVLSQAEVSPPASWEEIFSVGDTIATELPEIAPIQVGGAHLDLQAPLVWAAGGDIATQVAGVWQSGLDSPAGRDAFDHFESVWKKGWSPRDAVTWAASDIRTAFAEGRSAMMIGTLADLRAILSANPGLDGSVGTALLPEGPGGSRDAVATGSHLVVLKGSAEQEVAAAFVQHLTAPEHAVPLTEALGVLPGTRAGIDAAVADDEALVAFGEQLFEHSRTYPATTWWQEVVAAGAFETATQQLMHGQLTAPEAAAAVDSAIRSAIG